MSSTLQDCSQALRWAMVRKNNERSRTPYPSPKLDPTKNVTDLTQGRGFRMAGYENAPEAEIELSSLAASCAKTPPKPEHPIEAV